MAEGCSCTRGPSIRPASAGKAAARQYERPALQSYGRLVDVTGFGGSQIVDSGVGNLQNP